jgi:hypothetical protein
MEIEMVEKNILGTADELADKGRDALVTLGHDLTRTASHIEDATAQAAARGANAVRREGKRIGRAAKDVGEETARLTARTLRTHPYLSTAAILAGLVALAGITLLAARSTSR